LLSLIVQSRLTSDDSKKDPHTLRLAIEWYTRVTDEFADKELPYAWSKYVEWLNRKELYDDAVTFVKYYKTRFSGIQALEQSVQTLLCKQILILIDKKRLDAAENLLDDSAGVLALKTTRILAELVLAKSMEQAKRSKNFDHAIALTARLLAKGYLEEPVSQRYSQYLQAKKVHESGRRK
jgi:hypothetical protein